MTLIRISKSATGFSLVVDRISAIEKKYFNPNEDAISHMIFPQEEGLTMADINKGRHKLPDYPMMVTRISKSKVSNEQIVTTFLPESEGGKVVSDPRELSGNSIFYFVLQNDAKAWRWIDTFLKMNDGKEDIK